MRNQEVLIVAGGCGLAPLAATIDHLILGQVGATTVIYDAANRDSQVLRQERQRWQQRLSILETFMDGCELYSRYTLTAYQPVFGPT